MKNSMKTLCAAGSLLVAATAGAETFTVEATVTTAVALTETTPLSLGTVFISGFDTTDGSPTGGAMTIAPDGTVTSVPGTAGTSGAISQFINLGGQQAGVLSITGAAPFGTLTVDSSATPVALTAAAAPPGSPTILFTTLTTDPADTATLTLDAAGDGQVLVGGTFTAEGQSGGSTYVDGTYTGSYEVSVSY